jgi:hypothetical protein
MNYSELTARMASLLHRSDLTASMVDFVGDATAKVNARWGLQLAPLVLPDDTNEVLTDSPLVYLYWAMESAYLHLNDGDNATTYGDLATTMASQQNITAAKTSTDPYLAAGEPPYMRATT